MTTWQRVVYSTGPEEGRRFTVIERARESWAIRRGGETMSYTEAELRAMLLAVGEPPERIDELIASARHRAARDA
jgi:hypothetical protein